MSKTIDNKTIQFMPMTIRTQNRRLNNSSVLPDKLDPSTSLYPVKYALVKRLVSKSLEISGDLLKLAVWHKPTIQCYVIQIR